MQKVNTQITNHEGVVIASSEYNKDFYVECRNGNVPGHTIVTRSCRNEDVGAAYEIVNGGGLDNWQITSPQTFNIAAGGNAADDVGGTGVQEVTLELIDNAGIRTVEKLATNGVNASLPTTATHWRCMRMLAVTTGTKYGTNVGTITLESGGLPVLQMEPGAGHARLGAFSTSANTVARLLSFVISVSSDRDVSVRYKIGPGFDQAVTPFNPFYVSDTYDKVVSPLEIAPRAAASSMPEYTDLWFEAVTTGGGPPGAIVSVNFSMLVIDNSFTTGPPLVVNPNTNPLASLYFLDNIL